MITKLLIKGLENKKVIKTLRKLYQNMIILLGLLFLSGFESLVNNILGLLGL